MPRRLLSPIVGSGGVVAVTGLLLVACAADVEVAPTSPAGDAAVQCTNLIDQLPAHVAGQETRSVRPADTLAAAWGDPPIVLRCGVPEPLSLRPDSSCFVVNDIGWLAEQDGRPVTGTDPVDGELVFTTIGRSTYVEVTVPPDYQPAADALVDLSGAISAATDDVRPCV